MPKPLAEDITSKPPEGLQWHDSHDKNGKQSMDAVSKLSTLWKNLRTASSSKNNGGKDAPSIVHTVPSSEVKPVRAKLSYARWKQISYLMQFVVVSAALAVFLTFLSIDIERLKNAHVLESKETITVDKVWFGFAICLRPFITPDLMRTFYRDIVNKSFETYLSDLNRTKTITWTTDTWLDDLLGPEDYVEYFRDIHPWHIVQASKLWEYQHANMQRAFEEFEMNGKALTQNREEIRGYGDRKMKYTVLAIEKEPNASRADYTLLGEYNLSPIYTGCLNVTVNDSMSKRQMDITVKSRESMNDLGVVRSKLISINKVADLLVYDVLDSFTEIPVIRKLKRYSVQPQSRERLYVRGDRYQRTSTRTRQCTNETGYSQTDCRYWCVMRKLFDAVECALPWMEGVLQKPWWNETHKSIPACSDAAGFLKSLKVQHRYLQPKGPEVARPVKRCLEGCPISCSTLVVHLLSLGSKSLGNNYGMSITISPEMDTVTEHKDYMPLAMVAELSASISFLLGLSAIAIYDWIVSFGVWSAIRLGLYQPDVDPEPELLDQPDASVVPRASSQAPGLAALREQDEPTALASASSSGDRRSLIWYVEPSAGSPTAGSRTSSGRQDSLQLPVEGLSEAARGRVGRVTPQPTVSGHQTPEPAASEYHTPEPAASGRQTPDSSSSREQIDSALLLGDPTV